MRYVIIASLILTSCTASRVSFSQGLHTSSGRAIKAYNEGMTNFDFVDYRKAEVLFRQALVYDNEFFEAYLMLGELYTKQKKYSDAVINYRAALGIDSSFYKPAFFALANAELMTGDYENALIHYKSYLKYHEGSPKNRSVTEKNIRNCIFALEAVKNPVPFNPINAGAGVNTEHDEYWPSITADGQTLMFTRQIIPQVSQRGQIPAQEDLYQSSLSGGIWTMAVNAGEPLNTRNNEGAQTLSSSGNYMYFTACDRPGGMGSCDIFFSAYNNGRWTFPHNLGAPVNTSSWESTPSVSADGNMLFFSSTRPGGYGGKDLWVSVMNSKGTWGNPVNLGENINTEGDEMSPFIHFDGKTLYFASDGHPGMGGFDIYLSRMNSDSSWSEPMNLGYPVNTFNDEMGLVIEASGEKAFFSSKRDNINGKDIYYFHPDKSLRPEPVAYLKGRVSDRETGKLLKADYELINLSTNRVTIKTTTDEEGNFLVCLPSGFNYGLNVSKPGYLFYSENFMFEGNHPVIEPLVKRISLNPARVGEKMLLTNVFYEVDSWELKKESVEELNNLADMMTYNKSLIVEIGGYTDSTGTDEHNLALSEKRALSVVNFLIGKGLPSGRLKYKGYGNTSPVGDNVTSEGRKLNRRTEAKIIADIK